MVKEDIVDGFVRGCRTAAAHGLMRCSSGNMSLRAGEDLMLATCSRSWLGSLSADQVSVCRIADGALVRGQRPTVEVAFHSGILRARPDVNVVLHYQAPFATTVACLATPPANFNVIAEIPFYVGPVAQVPWRVPGSPELAAAVVEAMREHDLAIMRHHGQVTVARDIEHAIQNALFFELACEIIVRGGAGIAPLTDDAVNVLLAMRRDAAKSAV